jgi:hypothetical protein
MDRGPAGQGTAWPGMARHGGDNSLDLTLKIDASVMQAGIFALLLVGFVVGAACYYGLRKVDLFARRS